MAGGAGNGAEALGSARVTEIGDGRVTVLVIETEHGTGIGRTHTLLRNNVHVSPVRIGTEGKLVSRRSGIMISYHLVQE